MSNPSRIFLCLFIQPSGSHQRTDAILTRMKLFHCGCSMNTHALRMGPSRGTGTTNAGRRRVPGGVGEANGARGNRGTVVFIPCGAEKKKKTRVGFQSLVRVVSGYAWFAPRRG